MKKQMLFAATMLVAFAGCTSCGQGWRPNIFTRMYNAIHGDPHVGAPCDAGCQAVSQAAPVETGCTNCGESVHYGGTDSNIIGSYETPTIGQGVSTMGTSMGTLGSSINSIPSGSYSTSPMIAPRETIRQRLAN